MKSLDKAFLALKRKLPARLAGRPRAAFSAKLERQNSPIIKWCLAFHCRLSLLFGLSNKQSPQTVAPHTN